MNALKNHAPMLVFILVLALCGAGAWYFNEEAKSGEGDKKTINESIKKAEGALKDGVVADEYVFSSANAEKLKSSQTLKEHVSRNKKPENVLGTNVSYPQPMRPKSDNPEVLLEAKHIYATSPGLSGEAARADHGKIYVSADLPKAEQMLMLEPVRIEVFRGKGADKIDLSKPYATIELGLEEPPAPKAAGVVAPPPPPVDAPRVRGAGGTGNKPPPPPFKLGDQRAMRDTAVDQQTEYSYQMRLVLRFTSTDNKMEVNAKPDNTKETIVYHAPKLKKSPDDKEGMVAVAPMDPNTKSKLYATDYTTVQKAKTPSNFELRMAGVNGTVPPEGAVRNPDAHDRREYSVNFEVRVWVNELKDWKTAQLNEVKEGDTLSGKVQYRLPGAKEATAYDFTKDLSYKLYEVNNETVEGAVAGSKVTTEVAQLENLRTKAVERFVKTRQAGARPAKLDELDKVIEAQNTEIEKKRKEAAAGAPAAPAAPPAK